MKAKNALLYLLVFAMVGLTAVDTQAGDKKRRGTAGAQQLLVPLTARTAGLGSAMTSGVGTMNGLEALYANPAGLVLNGGTNAMFSRMEYVADIGVNYFGIAQRFGVNNIALTVSNWDFGDIALQTAAVPDAGDVTWSASYTTVTAAYAREFTDRISAGVAMKLVSERIDDVSSNGLAFDAGMTYVVGESGLRFGVSLKNFGPSRAYSGTGLNRFVKLRDQAEDAKDANVSLDGAAYELPSLLNFGISYTRPLGDAAAVSFLGNFRSNSFSSDQYSGALELSFQDLFFVRGGYQFEEDMDLTFYSGANFGAGLNLNWGGSMLTIDYAFRSTDPFDNVQVFTASLTL